MTKMTTLIVSALLSIGLTMGLAGCTPGNNIPGATFAGSAAGGLLGAALFHGSGAWIGVLGGALIGGIVGNQIGKQMDRQDQMNMQNAIVNTPVGQEATWRNSKRDITYTVRPVRNYRHHRRYCREYQTKVVIGGKTKMAYGRACRRPDGSWQVAH